MSNRFRLFLELFNQSQIINIPQEILDKYNGDIEIDKNFCVCKTEETSSQNNL